MGFLDPKPVTPANLDALTAGKIATPGTATATALSATFVPKWKAAMAYLAGDKVLSPTGDVVSAKVDFTTTGAYNSFNWNLSTSYATPAVVAGKVEKFTSAAPGGINQEVFSDVAVRGALKGTYLGGGGHIGNLRQPFGTSVIYDGATMPAAGGDKVIWGNVVTITGDFTPDWTRPGGAPKWIWGSNDFIVFGNGEPVVGITDLWARLSELHLRAPNTALNSAHGFVADVGLQTQAVGSSVVGWMSSIKAQGPTNHSGGTVGNSAGVYITSSPAGTSPNQWALYTSGTDPSRFGGNIEMDNNSAAPKYVNAQYGGFKGVTATLGNPGTAASGQLTVKAQTDATVAAWFQGRGSQTADVLKLGVDLVHRSRFDRRGRLAMLDTSVPLDADIATNEQMFYVANTAGAPKLMIKGKDSAGAVFTGSVPLASQGGATGTRPSAVTVGAGAQFYDTTLVKPIWSDGAVWRDAMGTAI